MRRTGMAAALIAALLAGGCSTADSALPTEQVNAVDVMFVQMMLPHNQQGMRLAGIAGDRAAAAEVRSLAAAIETTEALEIRDMTRWLHEWDQPLAAPSSAHAAHGGLPETSEKEIARLAKATSGFDRDFLTLMIAHQDDAVRMAKLAALNGSSPRVLNLARQVDRARSAQVTYMRSLLGK
ncbi:DUF305 domain-containing protein [Nonomuraea sp. NPDC050310]|uniref:DUF305 domain-containing protein n=1 Tax=unclassified Nonomuraea TaxID=2593643 RepID=UPI0033E92E64